ncbi:MAG TPA: peptidoglycan editing factor PgeF [Ghiorsea sp.]|nr:peptidoglycan editing factor PgeF [Ghiorsea sp.]HIP07254.1 peptidoglycan editing factor PgeF [Mariprofundaceae bacterium]
MFSSSELMGKHGVKAVFSDRQGGVSEGMFSSLNLGEHLGDDAAHVAENLATLCQQTSIPIPHQAEQVHGIEILYCQGAGKMHQSQADILIATETQVTLAVRTADCLPILLADIEAGVVAAVHAGWRGTVQHVVGVAVDAMCDKGAKHERILASLGPSIGRCCFEVSADIAASLSQSCGADVRSDKEGKVFADLSKTNQYQLRNKGLSASSIDVSQVCTYCNLQPHYFSYRRDCGKTGRQLAMVTLP